MSNPPPIQPLPYDSAGYLYQHDLSQLNLLAIFHYVLGGLVMLMACIPIIHVVLGILMITGKLGSGSGQPPPPALGWVFVGLGSLFIVLGWTLGILMIYSGRCLSTRRRWMFSVVIAALMCLNMPLGTILGVFTLVVLMRDSVKSLYGLRT
ncbi:MAG TPA: hypothetical protein VGI81_27780 [Tepidisphaeraceae bacterium]